MRCDAVAAGRTAPTSMDRRRRSTIASFAGPSAASGKASSAHSPEPRMRRTDCSSIVAASRSTAAQAAEKGAMAHGIGRTKGGRNTKLHAVCDAIGRPHVLLLTPGNLHDCKVARLCIEALPPTAELVADKGYDSQALREWLDERGTEAVIPRHVETARSSTSTTAPFTSSATSSSVCSAVSRTGVAWPPALIATSKTSWVPSLSPQPSFGGCSETGP
jgi:transposase